MAYSTIVNPPGGGSGGGSGGAAYNGGVIANPVLGPFGSAAAPAYAFSGATDLGAFAVDAHTLAWAVGGQKVAQVGTDGVLHVSGGLTVDGGSLTLPGGPGFFSSADTTPEGHVAAAPGSVWQSSAGGSDGLYFKRTGTGNVGWLAVFGNRSASFPLSAPLGDASAVPYAFVGNAGTGLHSAAGELALAAAGTDLLKLGTDGSVSLLGPASFSAPLTYASGATHTTGTGAPEGVVTASPGSTFASKDGGPKATYFVKETGTGNTGWTVVNPPTAVPYPLLAPAGSASAPSYSFAGSGGSGIFSSNTNELAWATAGSQRMRLSPGGTLSLFGALSIGADAVPASKAGVFGNLTIGSGIAGTTAAPTDGLLVQGQTTFQGSVAFQNGATGLSLSPTYPLSAPTGTTATPNVPYSFTGKSGWGLGYDTTSSFLNLYAAQTPILQVGSNVIQTTKPIGLGGATPSTSLVSLVAGSSPLSGVYAGGASLQVQAPASTLAGGGSFMALTNSGAWGGSFGYNEYIGGASSTVGTYLIAANSKPLTICVGANYLDVAATVWSTGASPSNSSFWNIGGKPQPLSTMGITGNLAVGGTVAAGTAAPSNGLLVQGNTVLQGNLTVSGSTTGITTAPSYPLSAPAGSASAPSYGFSTGTTGMFSPSANALALVTSGSTRLSIESGGNVTLGAGLTLSSPNAGYLVTQGQSRLVGPVTVGANTDTGSALGVSGSVAIGAAVFGQSTPAPANGLLVQGNTVLQGNLQVSGTVTGVQPSYPFSAPTGTTAAPNVPYAFASNSSTGWGYDTTASALTAYVGNSPKLQLTGTSALVPGALGVGGATPTASNCYLLVASTAETGAARNQPSLQVASNAGVGAEFLLTDGGSPASTLSYNKYTGNGVPVGTQLGAFNSKPLMICVGSTYTDIAATAYNASGAYYWTLGGSGQSASTLNVRGTLSVGSGVQGTAAQANGLLVQGTGTFGGWTGDSTNTEGALQINAVANKSASLSFYNQGSFGAYVGVNNFAGGANFPVGLWLRSYTANQSIYLTTSTTAGTVNYGLKVNPNGGVAIGSDTTAPANGLNVQGASNFVGNVTFQGSVSGVTATPSFPLSAPLSSDGTTPQYTFSGGTAGLLSQTSGAVSLIGGGGKTLTLASAGATLSAGLTLTNGGGLAVPGGASFGSSLSVSGTLGASTAANIGGLLTASAGATVSGALLTASAGASLSGGVAVGSTSTPGSTAAVSGNLAVGTGNATAAAPTNGVLVQGNTILQGNLTVQGTTTGVSATTNVMLLQCIEMSTRLNGSVGSFQMGINNTSTPYNTNIYCLPYKGTVTAITARVFGAGASGSMTIGLLITDPSNGTVTTTASGSSVSGGFVWNPSGQTFNAGATMLLSVSTSGWSQGTGAVGVAFQVYGTITP